MQPEGNVQALTYVIIGLMLMACLGIGIGACYSGTESKRARRTDVVDPSEPPWFV